MIASPPSNPHPVRHALALLLLLGAKKLGVLVWSVSRSSMSCPPGCSVHRRLCEVVVVMPAIKQLPCHLPQYILRRVRMRLSKLILDVLQLRNIGLMGTWRGHRGNRDIYIVDIRPRRPCLGRHGESLGWRS